MAYRRQQYQQAHNGSDPGWMLICALLAITLALAALPWVIIGFLAQRYLKHWLHWRVSVLVWLVMFLIGAFIILKSYQHGLQPLLNHELTDYTSAARHYQTDVLHWPLRQLWSDTWPVWLRTIPGMGIAGFVAEIYTAIRHDTAKTLRRHEHRRQKRVQRSQRRARQRTSGSTHLPDAIGGAMVVGVPIDDDTNEEA